MIESPSFPQSPSQTVGPFFHGALISDEGSGPVHDLVIGDRIRVTGRVLDGNEGPVDDALLEFWQPDANGNFRHPSDPRANEGDPHFFGFTRVDTAQGGAYEFDTIKPGIPRGSLEGLTPFICVTVLARGLLVHAVTRMYFSDEAIGEDPVLNSIDPSRRSTLVARLEDASGVPTYHFDVRLQGENETVFFGV